jgi:hypothetical protein
MSIPIQTLPVYYRRMPDGEGRGRGSSGGDESGSGSGGSHSWGGDDDDDVDGGGGSVPKMAVGSAQWKWNMERRVAPDEVMIFLMVLLSILRFI